MSTTTITTTKKVMNKFARNADVDEFLEKALVEAGYGGVDIASSPVGTRITLYVQRPGLVIGRRGMGIRDLTEKLEKKFGLPNPQISVVEEEVPELNPRIMCARISQTVIRGTAFRRAALWAMTSIMNAGALGVEITIAGKLRSERAHFERYVQGVVPKSGETADRIVRRATTDVLMKMGLYGVRVCIAIKNSVAPEIEMKEAVSVEPHDAAAEAPQEKTAQPVAQTKEPDAPRSSRRSSMSKKEPKIEDEKTKN
ncbi:MAG: 30S ribosomal protein S3 [Nitrososphaerales archaeon]